MTTPQPDDTDTGACVFCEKIRAMNLHHTQTVVDFEPLNPVTQGHRLIVPVKHVDNFSSEPQITAEVMRTAALLGQDYDACNIITSKGVAATQSVFHLHVHLVPRHPDDGLALPWTNQDTVIDMTTERPEANTGQAKSSRGDTGEAINHILEAYKLYITGDWQRETTLQAAYSPEMATELLQELIRGEVVTARHDEIKQLDNIVPDLWEKGNLTLGDMTRLMSYIANRDDAIDATLSSGQTDGWEKQTWTR